MFVCLSGLCVSYRGGCCFGYIGSLYMALFSIIGLTLAPIAWNVATTYYVAPHEVATTVAILSDLNFITNLTQADVQNLTDFANICLLDTPNSSLVAAASYLGYDIDSMIVSAVNVPLINFSSYGNVTDEVEEARGAARVAWVRIRVLSEGASCAKCTVR